MQPVHTTLRGALVLLGLTSAVGAQVPAPDEAAPVEAAPVETPVETPAETPVETSAAPVEEEFDLATLGLDPAAAFDDKLSIYGFADFAYQAIQYGPNALVPDTASFVVGNLNLYVAKNLTRRWRTLTEVRLLFAPNGELAADGSYTSTTSFDPANLYRPIQWGGIRIERAYLEYDLHPRLTIRAGHWLSPYGIWNVDHGSPTIIPTFRPYVIGEQFIPEHQTGLHAFGSTYVGAYQLGYHATISNGRSASEATSDRDRRPAFGGRLELIAPWAGTVKLGGSAYAGRATEVGPTVVAPVTSYDEMTYAVDAAWHRGGLLVQGEAMVRERRYRTGGRPVIGAGMQPDGRDVGMYVLAGYRLERAWNVMPFGMYERYKPLQRVLFDEMQGLSMGLNFRPAPSVVLKAMATVGATEGIGVYGEIGRIFIFGTQAAWVF